MGHLFLLGLEERQVPASVTHTNLVARLDQERRDIRLPAIHVEVAVQDKLARLSTRFGEYRFFGWKMMSTPSASQIVLSASKVRGYASKSSLGPNCNGLT